MEGKPRKFLEQVRDMIRIKHLARSTEESYVVWIKRFILFHDKKHPNTMGEREIESFLTHLAVDRKVAASTQSQALCALVFLYRQVLRVDLDDSINAVRARQPRRLPVVLSKEEAVATLRRTLTEDDFLLVKASRAMALETLIEELTA